MYVDYTYIIYIYVSYVHIYIYIYTMYVLYEGLGFWDLLRASDIIYLYLRV